MKKKILLTAGLLFSLFATSNLFAQDAKSTGFTDVKGINVVNAGVGLGAYGLAGTGGLPITATFEHGFTKNISAGVTLGFIKRNFATDWSYTYLVFGARGSYHLNEAFKISNPKLDIYTGAGLFYRRFSVKYSDHSGDAEENFDFTASGGDVIPALHLGGRYLFNNKIGAFAELGYGISPLQLGVSVKF